jgi:hypothetical protein
VSGWKIEQLAAIAEQIRAEMAVFDAEIVRLGNELADARVNRAWAVRNLFDVNREIAALRESWDKAATA